jgi:O-acetylhomoserine (thiol)-lyase
MTALEGGTGAVAFASGHAAIAGTFLNFLQTGDEIASSSSLYGGTFNLLQHTLPRLGINTRFFDARDPASLEKTITGSTKAFLPKCWAIRK